MNETSSQPIAPEAVPRISIFGLVDLEHAILCARDALGKSIPISIGGVHGFLEMPNLPEDDISSPETFEHTLKPPAHALSWKRERQLLHWGKPMFFPSWTSSVDILLLRFEEAREKLPISQAAIHSGFDRWRTLFVDYVELITKQLRVRDPYRESHADDLELLTIDHESRPLPSYQGKKSPIVISIIDEKTALNEIQLRQVCELASECVELPLDCKLQLASYRAFRVGDFRKAVIETAVAAEIALSKALKARIEADGVPQYADRLLARFRMLRNLIELAKVVGVELPENLTESVLTLRNGVVHRGIIPEQREAIAAIRATDILIRNLSPESPI